MGLAISLEAGRTPLLAGGRALRWLAMFGLLHGFHEWYELYLMVDDQFASRFLILLDLIRLILLVTSFSFLIIFSLLALSSTRISVRKKITVFLSLLIGFLFILFLDSRIFPQPIELKFLRADALSRYFLGVTGAFFAGLALFHQSRQARSLGHTSLSTALVIASAGFWLYSLTQLFVRPQEFLLSNWINTASFMKLTTFPIQMVRGGLAILIMISLIRAMQIGEEIRKNEFDLLQQTKVDALEQIQRDLVERESLRRELLRRTVLAQEEERSRIARELHDETAQILTAFNLHLASLSEIFNETKAVNQITYLKKLSQQMADGIYRLVYDLRPAQLDDLGLVPALKFLVEEINRQTGLEVSLDIKGTYKRLDSLIETVIFRVTQESLTNVVRHSGVNRAWVTLEFRPDYLIVEVTDHGCGFSNEGIYSSPQWLGLAGMRERVDAVGGQFEIHTEPGKGTRISVHISLVQGSDRENLVLPVLVNVDQSPNE